jgi:hypothetical protein
VLLGQQLQVIDELSRLLIQNRVEQLRSIRRVEVEPGAASTDALNTPVVKDPQGLYTALPFEVQFACSAESLRQILNALTEARWFFNVRQVAVNTETIETGATAAVTPAASTVPAGEARAAERVKRTLLVVTLNVDLVEFAEPVAAPPGSPARR